MANQPSLRLIVRRPVPSLNVIFKMQHWGWAKEKRSTQAAFLSALQVTANDSSIPITSVQSGFLMRVAIPALSLMIARRTLISKSGKKK